MEEHTVPVGYLILPVLLPFTQRRLLQQTVGLDDQFRCGGFEAHTTLDADDGVAYIGITANSVGGTDLLDLLDGPLTPTISPFSN